MNLYLKPDEQAFLSMAVVSMKEKLENERINFNPEARRYLKEMVAAGSLLEKKLLKLGFDMTPLPPFVEGDEDEFLTKES